MADPTFVIRQILLFVLIPISNIRYADRLKGEDHYPKTDCTVPKRHTLDPSSSLFMRFSINYRIRVHTCPIYSKPLRFLSAKVSLVIQKLGSDKKFLNSPILHSQFPLPPKCIRLSQYILSDYVILAISFQLIICDYQTIPHHKQRNHKLPPYCPTQFVFLPSGKNIYI